MKSKTCKDCEPGVKRPAPYPGPRCATHHRARKKLLKEQNHARHIQVTYGITGEQYQRLLEAQEGVCFICRRANGASRKLAVDHSHVSGFVRGLLCGPCNKILGHLRDDPGAGLRIANYLYTPPAFDVIGMVKSDES